MAISSNLSNAISHRDPAVSNLWLGGLPFCPDVNVYVLGQCEAAASYLPYTVSDYTVPTSQGLALTGWPC